MKSVSLQSHTGLIGGAFAALLFSGCVCCALFPLDGYAYEVVTRNEYQRGGERVQRTMLRNRPSSVAVKKVVAFVEDEGMITPAPMPAAVSRVNAPIATRFPSVKRTEMTVKPLSYYNRPVQNIARVESTIKIVHPPREIRTLPVQHAQQPSSPVVAPQKTVVVLPPQPVHVPVAPSSPAMTSAPVTHSYVVLPWMQEKTVIPAVAHTEIVAPQPAYYQPVAAVTVMPEKKMEESPVIAQQKNPVVSEAVDFTAQPVVVAPSSPVVEPALVPQPAPIEKAQVIEKIEPEIVEIATVRETPAVATIPPIDTKEAIAIQQQETIEQVQEPAPLSSETEGILDNLPQDIFPEPRKVNPFDVKRSKQDVEIPAEAGGMGIGASVAVRRQTIDANYELEKAYNALLRGNTDIAISMYQDILSFEPNNQHALFGLATTYHKLGLLDKARPIYGKLLEIDPYNKETLNNFLALVGEEAPESAIRYLEQLKGQNSDFSPIYAQLAQLYVKQGNKELAIENMQEAVAMSPDNLIYKYNLAVLYDNTKEADRAMVLYRQLIKAGLDGAELPANLRDIQERLTFLSSNRR